MSYGCNCKHIGIEDKAIAEFTKAIKLDPKYGKAYFARAMAYMSKGKFQKAKADCQKAHDLGYAGSQSLMNTLVTEEKLWGENLKNEAEVKRKLPWPSHVIPTLPFPIDFCSTAIAESISFKRERPETTMSPPRPLKNCLLENFIFSSLR